MRESKSASAKHHEVMATIAVDDEEGEACCDEVFGTYLPMRS
jgi:hypothetical protein